jgi:adenine phosphoribosyltransferase
MNEDDLTALIRSIPDYPRKGILFRDVTTLIGHGAGFAATVDWLSAEADTMGAQAIVGIEARGFIFGAPVAARMGLPFIPVRKPGKLPVRTLSVEYELEYGTDRLELDPNAVAIRQRVVVIDDLLATGGTALAAVRLVREAGGVVDGALFVIDLPDLGGSAALDRANVKARSLMSFQGR